MAVFQYERNLAEFDECLYGDTLGDPSGDDALDDSLGECEYCGESVPEGGDCCGPCGDELQAEIEASRGDRS